MTPEEERIVGAWADALRGIAAATVACRAQVRGMRIPDTAAATFLADVEHHLASLVVLGAVPPDTGRAVTSSVPLPGDPRALG